MNNTRDSLFDTVRNNPIPAALTGIGLAWLLMNRSSAAADRARSKWDDDGRGGRVSSNRSQHDRRPEPSLGNEIGRAVDGAKQAGGHLVEGVEHAAQAAGNAIGGLAHQASDRASTAIHTARDAAGHLVDQTSHAAGDFAHMAKEQAGRLTAEAATVAGHVTDEVRGGARRVERVLGDTLRERPMVLGAVAFAAGAAVALSLPRTDREDSLMGEVRDELVQRAQAVGGDVAHTVQELGTEGAKSAINAVAGAVHA